MKTATKLSLAALVSAAMAWATDIPPAPAEAHRGVRGMRGNPDAGLVSRRLSDGAGVRFLDLRADAGDLKPILDKMQQSFGVAIDCVKADKGENCAMRAAAMALEGADTGVAIAISNEGEDMPTLVVCPEDRMAVINADRLADASGEVFAKRLTQEMWRAVALVMGGYESDYPCVMKTVTGVADLDANPLQMTCPPVSGHIAKNAEKFGLAKVQTVPYFVALRQGWAPEPANDAQRAEKERYEKARARTTERASATNATATKAASRASE